MILLVFSVYDSKAAAFLQPFFAVNRAVAIRSFSRACSDESHDFHANAGDFTLFCIGQYDQTTGGLTAMDAFENCGIGSQFVDGGVKSNG